MPEQEVLLRVEHLCQYFKSNKAVDDVSFDIKKGEVFGLVGESGCGKTTTGRSIIKLYDITSGNIYFKGKRIAAGVGAYKQAIAQARQEMKTADAPRKEELKRFIAQPAAGDERPPALTTPICDKIHADDLAQEVDRKYQPLLEKATGDELTPAEEGIRRAAPHCQKAALHHPDSDDLPGPHRLPGPPHDGARNHCRGPGDPRGKG